MFNIGLTGIGIIVLITVIWGVIIVKNEVLHKKKWEWIHPIIATFVSVSLGFCIFFIQQGLSEFNRKDALKAAVLADIKIILEYMGSIGIENGTCTSSGSGALLVNSKLLPVTAIKMAAESNLFDSAYTGHFIRLQGIIEEHNRWADFGFQILKNPSDPHKYDQMLAQQRWQAIDMDLNAKALFISECLTTGSSPSTGDYDCI